MNIFYRTRQKTKNFADFSVEIKVDIFLQLRPAITLYGWSELPHKSWTWSWRLLETDRQIFILIFFWTYKVTVECRRIFNWQYPQQSIIDMFEIDDIDLFFFATETMNDIFWNNPFQKTICTTLLIRNRSLNYWGSQLKLRQFLKKILKSIVHSLKHVFCK